MKRADQIATADRIAAEHGCEISPTAAHVPHIGVLRSRSDGRPRDPQRVERCRVALEAAGISTDGWVS